MLVNVNANCKIMPPCVCVCARTNGKKGIKCDPRGNAHKALTTGSNV